MTRYWIRFGVLLLVLLPLPLFAQPVYCGGLPGCGPGWTNFIEPVLTLIAAKLPIYALWLGELFLAIGALFMLLNLGDDQRIEQGKKIVIWSLVGIALAMFAEEFVTLYLATEEYVDVGTGTDLIVDIIAAFLRITRNFFGVAILAAVIFNAFRMVLSRGNDEEYAKAKIGFFWAAIGAVLVNIAGRLVLAVLGLPL